jgi:hypothetical protein
VTGEWIHNTGKIIIMITDKGRPSEKIEEKSSFKAGITSREIAKQSRTAYNGVFLLP